MSYWDSTSPRSSHSPLRRAVVVTAAVLLADPARVLAQSPPKVHRVGVLSWGTAENAGPYLRAFEESLASQGFVVGKNLRLTYAFERTIGEAAAARNLVAQGQDVLFGANARRVKALNAAAPTLPTVFAFVSDPVANGLVADLS